MKGFEAAKKASLAFLETFKQPAVATDRELLRCVARTSLRTKLHEKLADQLTDIVTDAVLMIRKEKEPIDLYMVRACAPHSVGEGLQGCRARCLLPRPLFSS